MIYIFSLFMLLSGFYSVTYGISLWKDKKFLAGIGAITIATFGTLVPLVVMFIKR